MRVDCKLRDVLKGLKPEVKITLEEGVRVRVVAENLDFKHVPKHKAGFDPKGCVGTVVRVYKEENLSPNRHIKVQFDEPSKWIGHFEPEEIQVCSD